MSNILMNPWFDDLFNFYLEEHAVPRYRKSSQLTENGENYLLKMEVPGFQNDAFKIQFSNQKLKISAHQKADKSDPFLSEERNFSYQVDLFDNVDIEKITAEYKAGILLVTLPKVKSNKALTREISVKG